jgi:hypothetical protein
MAFVHRAGLDGGEADLSLTPAQKRDARQIFAEGKACGDCGGIHPRACPRVKRQVWLRSGPGDGQRTEVEFWRTYDQTGIIWPEDAYDPDDEVAADGS